MHDAQSSILKASLAVALMSSSRLLSCVSATPIHLTQRAGGKSGIAWPGQTDGKLAKSLVGGNAGWYYDWADTPRNIAADWVPQLQIGSDTATSFASGVTVLGFNEPDQRGLSIADTVQRWTEVAGPLKAQGHRLGSPGYAVTDNLYQFLDACRASAACNAVYPDFAAIHVYQSDVDAFKGAVTEAHNRLKMPLWVTEFACHNFGSSPPPASVQQVKQFMAATTSFLESQNFVERYSWFGAGRAADLYGVNPFNRLQDDSGALTPLGVQYLSHPTSAS